MSPSVYRLNPGLARLDGRLPGDRPFLSSHDVYQSMPKAHPTVFVGMSGGVDSSVAAALLKQQGYEVVGVFMKNWSEDVPGGFCNAEADFADVRAVCQHLDIPYYTFNFEAEYKQRVLSYFFSEYKAGRTPNPDVMCNKEIKFELFLKKALSLGADYIATGHYAQKVEKDGRHQMLKGNDPIKDQTYFLYNLTQAQLSKTLFPVGKYPKKQVRALAKKFKLPTATKKDSQGICFIGPVDVREFLKTVLKVKPGQIVDQEGKVLGRHEGAWFYTIGQRRVEGLAGQPEPLYVVSTDIQRNLVVVGPDSATYAKGVILDKLHLVDPQSKPSNRLEAKPRYGPDIYPGQLHQKNRQWQFIFDTPQRALTPGQSLVIYDKKICLGGGVIQSVIK